VGETAEALGAISAPRHLSGCWDGPTRPTRISHHFEKDAQTETWPYWALGVAGRSVEQLGGFQAKLRLTEIIRCYI